MKRTLQMVVLLSLLCSFAAPAMADEPGWRDVPGRLKIEDGVERREEFVFATGRALAMDSVRSGKAADVARKKSLFRALQGLRIGVSCPELISGLGKEGSREFVRYFAGLAPSVHLERVTVIRQWEKGRIHYTTVAVPLSALEDLQCEFPNLSTAITRYAETQQVSLEGLAFCLRHVPPYTLLNRTLRERTGQLFQKRGQKALALCFLPNQNSNIGNSPLETLAFQNRLDRAAKYTRKAEALAAEGKWDNAIGLVSRALNLAPTYAEAYLPLSDYFLHELKMRTFALSAAEESLRDGTCLQKGLGKIVSCQKDPGSPEAEVFDFLLSQFSQGRQGTYPAGWQGELDRLADTSIPYLVISSAGCAIEGRSEPPGEEFVLAAALFQKAKSDDDVRRVIALLLKACEKHPKSAKTYNLIGACYRNLGQPAVALPFLWQALRLKPEYDYALTNLGICCQNLGLMKSARFYFDQDAVRNSPSPWVQESYAKFYAASK